MNICTISTCGCLISGESNLRNKITAENPLYTILDLLPLLSLLGWGGGHSPELCACYFLVFFREVLHVYIVRVYKVLNLT